MDPTQLLERKLAVTDMVRTAETEELAERADTEGTVATADPAHRHENFSPDLLCVRSITFLNRKQHSILRA
jgi:hypothetical protein